MLTRCVCLDSYRSIPVRLFSKAYCNSSKAKWLIWAHLCRGSVWDANALRLLNWGSRSGYQSPSTYTKTFKVGSYLFISQVRARLRTVLVAKNTAIEHWMQTDLAQRTS